MNQLSLNSIDQRIINKSLGSHPSEDDMKALRQLSGLISFCIDDKRYCEITKNPFEEFLKNNHVSVLLGAETKVKTGKSETLTIEQNIAFNNLVEKKYKNTRCSILIRAFVQCATMCADGQLGINLQMRGSRAAGYLRGSPQSIAVRLGVLA